MSAIQESKWEQIITLTWGQLASYLWEDFRLALMESETEIEAQGVVVKHAGAANDLLTTMQAQGVRVEHSHTIAETNTQMVVSIVVSDRDYKTEMLNYLPLYERKSLVFKEIMTAYDREFRNAEQQLDVIDRNIFIDTAIESLPIFERDLGIQPVKTLRYDQRREQITSRNRASFDQTTEETIKSVASAFSNGEVEVNSTAVIGIYEIKFIGTKGIPNNMDGLKKALDIVIPAHLGISYTFIFNAWEFWQANTWESCADKSWNDLRILNEVS